MSAERYSTTIPLSVFKRALRLLWEELFLLGLAGYTWWGALNAFAGLLIWADLRYYQELAGDVGIAFVTLAILLALAWSVIQILTLPFLIEFGSQHLKDA